MFPMYSRVGVSGVLLCLLLACAAAVGGAAESPVAANASFEDTEDGGIDAGSESGSGTDVSVSGTGAPTVSSDEIPLIRSWNRSVSGAGTAGDIAATDDGAYRFSDAQTASDGRFTALGATGRLAGQESAGTLPNIIASGTVAPGLDAVGDGFALATEAKTPDAALVRKYDASGSPVWTATPHAGQVDFTEPGPVLFSRAFGATDTGSGGVVATGLMQKVLEDTDDPFGAMLMRLDANGNEVWNRSFEPGSGNDAEHGLDVVSTSSGFLIAGVHTDFTEGDPDPINALLLGTSGDQLSWSKTLGGPGDDRLTDIKPAGNGSYVVAGEKSTGSGTDAWLLKVGAGGSIQWERTYGGAGDQAATGVVQTDQGNFTLAGETTRGGSTVPWLVHTNPEGESVWNATLEVGGGAATDITLNGDYYGIVGERGSETFVAEVIRCRDTTGDGDVDTDGDALCDNWEANGINVDDDSEVELDLPARGADPLHKDIFVEVDTMAAPGGDTPLFQPRAGVLDSVEQAFAESPVSNPDGEQGIDLHLTRDEKVEYSDYVLFNSSFSLGEGVTGDVATFDEIKNGDRRCGTGDNVGSFGTPANRTDENCEKLLKSRALVYRYALFADQRASSPNSGGIADLPGDDFLVTLGTFNTWVRKIVRKSLTDSNISLQRYGDILRDVQASTLMHELGHTLNLRHGGDTNTNNKPNYLSVMNYAYQLPKLAALGKNETDGAVLVNRPLDYSRTAVDLDEANLDEAAGVSDLADGRVLFQPRNATGGTGEFPRRAAGPTGGPVDWDLDGTVESGVTQSVNGDGRIETLGGYEDWPNLQYNHRSTTNFVRAGAGVPELNVSQFVTGFTGGEDVDGDSIPTLEDNCPWTANSGQADGNGDDVGDACSGGDPPVPDVQYGTATAGQPVTFDASNSTDPDGDELVTYEWTFPDGTAVGPTATYTFPSAGTYTVSVRVGDANYSTATADLTVTVEEPGGPGGPPAFPGLSQPRDLDGDGLYEDVRGDGRVNILDVQSLFNNLGSPILANYTTSFNFQPGDGGVTILDVQQLFTKQLAQTGGMSNVGGLFTVERLRGFATLDETGP
jgi:hypothetical protein